MGFLPDNLPNRFIGTLGSANVVTTTINFTSSWKMSVKRAVDVVGALVGLIITGIAYIFVAPAIKHASPGPVFFAQERVGRNGRIFKMYKFRSMYVDAEEDGPDLATENDERLTPTGKFLRAHHLDELPQLWNVLKGDMAFVGYRPERKFYIDRIMENDARYERLYAFRPGVTSYATIYNGYTDTMEKMLRRLELDLGYMEKCSFLTDVKITCLTFSKIVFGKKF